MKSYLSPKIKINQSRIGKGLFVVKKIKKGELIVDFEKRPSKFLKTKNADKVYRKGKDYMIQVDNDLFFAATNKKELEDADSMNHSCEPNCGTKGKLKIVTMKNIEPGKEITFDYAISEYSNYRMRCKCNSKNCRKFIIGEDWKIKNLQKKYKGFFSDHIQKKNRRSKFQVLIN